MVTMSDKDRKAVVPLAEAANAINLQLGTFCCGDRAYDIIVDGLKYAIGKIDELLKMDAKGFMNRGGWESEIVRAEYEYFKKSFAGIADGTEYTGPDPLTEEIVILMKIVRSKYFEAVQYAEADGTAESPAVGELS